LALNKAGLEGRADEKEVMSVDGISLTARLFLSKITGRVR